MTDSGSPFQEILDIPIINDKTIIELLEYDNYSHWWSLEYNIHTSVLNHSIPSNTYSQSIITRIFTKIRSIKIIDIYLCMAYDLINYIIFQIENKLYRTQSNKAEKTTSSIIFPFDHYDWRLDKKSNSRNLENIYNKEIISQLPNDVKVITPYDADIFSFKSHHSVYPKIISSNYRYVSCIYWEYWSWSTWISEKKSITHFQEIWDQISVADNWFSKWNLAFGINTIDFKEYFKTLVIHLIPKAISFFAMAERAIMIEKPSAIILTNEYSMHSRGWIYAAKKHSVKSIAIQHGTISKNHQKYCLNHNPQDVSVAGKKIGTSYPIPDITCVWGKSDYDVLVKYAGYPKDQVIITGNPRYDYLSQAHEKYSRSAFCTKYNINPSNRIILWTTGTHGENYEDNIAYINEVISACNVIPNVTLIIKQHPNEQPEHTKIYRDAMEKNKDRFQIILPDKMEDTTEMVFSSDILIIRASTVGQEAVAFHKPIIILDFSEKKDLLEYVKENVAVPAYCEGSLRNALITCLQNNPITRDNQDTYITNHMNRIDGLAAKRIAKIIEDNIHRQ
ncbi:UDP-N-acetylglucosamine 2-epimerase [Methanomicrobium mobile]|uniref:UDP-N-acetylglucosamine 2-epimerase n=1 Tax=Methanomicrobium mobile TaxID=2205 RepID=UPI0005B2B197|nr:UDP-N-acetylglucosamine 2-epimerase [Methanomicrobium mobile]